MSRLVDTHFLIAHWGFPSFHLGHWHDWLYWSIILIGDSDTVIFFVLHWYICLRYLTWWLWWLIRIDRGFRDSYFLCASLIYSFEVLICWLYWLIISYCLAHWSWFCHACSDHFTCIHSPLYITRLDMLILWLVILFWPSLSMMLVSLFVLIVVFSLILCVYEWYILLCLTVWCMTALPLHDCMPSVYVGLTSIPLPPNLLVSVISFISVLTSASVRPSMCLFSDWAKD